MKNHFSVVIMARIVGETIGLVASVCVRLCPSVCLWALSCLNCLTFDLDFWHEGQPCLWLAWDRRSRSKVKVKQCVFAYALLFEPLVQSRLILGLGLPSSANGNCEWPLPVHWNCLFVSNKGALQRVARKRSISFNFFQLQVCHDIFRYWKNDISQPRYQTESVKLLRAIFNSTSI